MPAIPQHKCAKAHRKIGRAAGQVRFRFCPQAYAELRYGVGLWIYRASEKLPGHSRLQRAI
jgi:hypothetical protein